MSDKKNSQTNRAEIIIDTLDEDIRFNVDKGASKDDVLTRYNQNQCYVNGLFKDDKITIEEYGEISKKLRFKANFAMRALDKRDIEKKKK